MFKNKTRNLNLLGFVTVLVIFGAVAYFARQEQKFSDLIKCFYGRGVVMYGASWCPLCKYQKELFGKFQSKLTYVECSNIAELPQYEHCTEAGIRKYPTWVDKYDVRYEGYAGTDTLYNTFKCDEVLLKE